MIVTKGIRFSNLLKWSGPHIIWLLILMTSITLLYEFKLLSFSIPWLPISVIGTAVAFYVGFKNNQAYDRMWEARKIWGGIVNHSRSWGMLVNSFVSNLFIEKPLSEKQLHSIKQRLIYRHIAWLYTHRNQLLAPTSWEHISQGGHLARTAEFYQRKFGVGLVDDQMEGADPVKFLSEGEFEKIKLLKNKAMFL